MQNKTFEQSVAGWSDNHLSKYLKAARANMEVNPSDEYAEKLVVAQNELNKRQKAYKNASKNTAGVKHIRYIAANELDKICKS